MNLTKLSETASTLTLGWAPPQGVGGYVFYANGVAVSTGSPNLKGVPRKEIKFSKTTPGPPFKVAAVCMQSGILLLDVGTYSEELPPATGDKLAWAPPVLGAGGVEIDNFTLTDATRNSGTLTCSPIGSKDIRITQTGVITSGPMAQISGYRNIEWIGGEFNLNNTSSGSGALIIRNCTGIAHIEGVWLRGSVMVDCLVVRSAEATEGGILQVQNCRFEAHESSTEHADCIQFQGAKLDGFRYDKCTFYSELQGMFMRVGANALTGDYARNGDLRRINYRGPGDNTFWQCWEQNDATVEFKKIIPITLDDVWVAEDGDTRSVGMRVLPRMDFVASAQAGGPRRGNFPGTDATGQYTRFSTAADIVPTGAAAGQACLPCDITGVIRKGIPPGGDYVPGVAGSNLGLNYVSPGYQ